MFFLRNHTFKCIVLVLPVLFFFPVCAQVHELPPDQPEQDASSALTLCDNSFYTPHSYTGIGKVSDLAACLCIGGEVNSVWFKLIISSAGRIVFRIIPVNEDDNYDFAVLNTDLASYEVVRCNFNNDSSGSNVKGMEWNYGS